jgi:hypothetical protein
LVEAVSDYDFTGDIVTQPEELLGIEKQVPSKGIIKLKEMAQLIDKVTNNRIIKFCNYKRSSKYITDKQLHFICLNLLMHRC